MAERAVMWFRRDLRLGDNPALRASLDDYSEVVPLFAWDQALTDPSGPHRLAFLSGCLDALAASAGALVERRGRPAEVVTAVAAECGARAVYATADFGPYGRRRDGEVEKALREAGVAWRPVDSPYAVAPGALRTGTGGAFQVFSPFHRAWRSHGWAPPVPAPNASGLTDAGVRSDRRPPIASGASLPRPGETAALERLEWFLDGPADRYHDHRDRPDIDGSSRLSPYLRFGCLHPRQALARLDRRRKGHDRFETELCWRDFYADVLCHRPDAARQSYREEWRRFETDEGADADQRFEAWATGRTGYPIVDAGMRQLQAEGWMPNRVRMIVASFLVKDLHVDWGRGARWFMQHLVDGDLASNSLNWQWVAGSGTDAAPYFRVFNPVTQGRKFDPSGDYVRRWVPELAGVAGEAVHDPGGAGLLARGYPPPIVDHAAERREALARYEDLQEKRTARSSR